MKSSHTVDLNPLELNSEHSIPDGLVKGKGEVNVARNIHIVPPGVDMCRFRGVLRKAHASRSWEVVVRDKSVLP